MFNDTGSSSLLTKPAVYIIITLFSLIAVILAFIFLLPKKRQENLRGFGRFLSDVCDFKQLLIEKIMKGCYIFCTVFVMLTGIVLLFTVEKVPKYTYQSAFSGYGKLVTDYESKWLGGYGLLLIIFGPIAIRIAYELVMMFILLVKNTIEINGKLKNPAPQGFSAPASEKSFASPARPDPRGFAPAQEPCAPPVYNPAPAQEPCAPPAYNPAPAQPEPAPFAPPAPAGWQCPVCGSAQEGEFCTRCGSRRP